MEDFNLPIFAICLDSEVERKKTLLTNLNSLGLKASFIGVKGNDLPEKFRHRYSETESEETFGRALGAAEVGCYASHIQAWENILNDGLDYALIIESDAVLGKQAIATIKAIVESEYDWDLVQLSWWNCIPSYWQRKKLKTGNMLVRFSRKTYQASAYLLNKKGAEELLRHSEKIKMPLDHMMFTGKVKKDISLYGVYPRCVELLENNLDTSLLEKERSELKGGKHRRNDKRRRTWRTFIRSIEKGLRHFVLKIRKPPSL